MHAQNTYTHMYGWSGAMSNHAVHNWQSEVRSSTNQLYSTILQREPRERIKKRMPLRVIEVIAYAGALSWIETVRSGQLHLRKSRQKGTHTFNITYFREIKCNVLQALSEKLRLSAGGPFLKS